MARSARQQRRQRRAGQLEPAAAGAGAPPPPPSRPVRGGDDEPERRVRADAPPRAEPKRRFSFVRESYGELQKVDWPGRNQVTQGTIVVIIACAIVGAYLWVLDLGLKQVVENVILRGS